MRQRVFRDGHHLQDIRSEDIFDFGEVDFRVVLADLLLGGVVDEDVESFVSGLLALRCACVHAG